MRRGGKKVLNREEVVAFGAEKRGKKRVNPISAVKEKVVHLCAREGKWGEHGARNTTYFG